MNPASRFFSALVADNPVIASDLKICPHCNKMLAQSEFSLNSRRYDGLEWLCKPCTKAYKTAHYRKKSQEYNARQRERRAAASAVPEDMKRCSRCKQTVSMSEFDKDENRSDGLNCQCNQCRFCSTQQNRNKHREWLQKNAESQRAQALKRYHGDPQAANQARVKRDRANLAALKARRYKYLAKKEQCEGFFTAQEWLDMCAHYNHRCAMCGEEKPLTIDHIIPRSKKGPNTINNIQPLCAECNARKGNRTLEETP